MTTTPAIVRTTARSGKRRADCFFGLHFDHHAKRDDTILNERVSEQQVRRIIELTRCDYIQHDCKGHPGIAGYPDSQAGVSPSGLTADALAIYRNVTAELGVNLYVHFSGVWDNQAVEEHPQWGVTPPPAGRIKATSTFGPYVRERLIPQMLEVIDRYRVDGFWVDGDCWATEIDHCDEAIRRFREATGESQPPAGPGEANWLIWHAIHRDQFAAYLAEYVHAVHEKDPGCEVCSNWLHSTHAPEPIKAPVDFVSGDFTPSNAVNSARLEARYLSNVGKPWDLMAWAFVNVPGATGRAYKSAEQLQQEAAQVLALGGGFQFYFHPDRHGAFSEAQLALMERVAAFCHERKTTCWQSETIGQVALLLDTTSYYAASESVFRPWNGQYEAIKGALHATLDAGHACDVLADHQFNWQQDRYKVVLVPEWADVPVSMVEELTAYVERGGSLLVIGAAAAERFAPLLSKAGIELVGEARDELAYLQVNESQSSLGEAGAVPVAGRWRSLRVGGSAEVAGDRTPGVVEGLDAQPAVAMGQMGAGRVAVVPGSVGLAYRRSGTPWLRDWLDDVLCRLYKPIVRVEPEQGRATVDVVLRRKAGRTMVHLLNVADMPTAAADQPGGHIIDRVRPTGPLKVHINLKGRPRDVRIEPQGTLAASHWNASESTLTVNVPSVHLHIAIAIE
ncbi:hypothetical protein ACERK3_12385 [Phycisphaerales bacterium AB-hyl4]|uniref:Alpha-L-fucosidase n=1 Tax=Natronomicrosphaera hydrolytica TaxID=3242702 RepID=A0ABV4U8L5_9BACT